ncbi:unnamed protein product [Caenorhabditis nigoni]
MRPNSLDFPDFEFWWMRFSAENFDLDYDRSKDPKYQNLGDNYQNEYRFTFRKVCKSFRSLADSWIPKFEKLVIEAYGKDVALNFNEGYFYYKDQNLALNDLISIIAHPEHNFNNLCVASYLNKQFSERLVLKLESMNIKIHVESIYMNYENWRDQKRLLTFYEAEAVKMVYIKGSEKKMVKFIEEICELDQEERAGGDQNSKRGNLKPRSMLFSRMDIQCRSLCMKEATKIIKEKYRFVLRNVCKSFRRLVDSWTPKFKNISIDSDYQRITVEFDDTKCRYDHFLMPFSNRKHHDLAVDDLISVFNFPNFKFEELKNGRKSIIDKRFLEKFLLKLELLSLKIHVATVSINYSGREIDILKFCENPEILKIDNSRKRRSKKSKDRKYGFRILSEKCIM